MPLVSVIIPVYNVENYLPECIESLLGQSLKDIEIILIDDDSTDDSGKICDIYSEKDDRIRVIHQKNSGVSSARNTGIDFAKSDHIMFVDSDDFVDKDFCRAPYEIAKQLDSDLVMFGYKNTDASKAHPDPAGFHARLLDRSEAMEQNNNKIIVWNKLYKTELFSDIRFPEGCVYEDIGTTYKLVHKATRPALLNMDLYYYRIKRSGSITASKDPDLLKIRTEMQETRIKDMELWGYDVRKEKVKAAWWSLVYEGRNTQHSKRYDEMIRSIKGFPEFFSIKQKAALLAYKISPFLFDNLCSLTGKRPSIP